MDVGQTTTGTSASAHLARSSSSASHMCTTKAGSRERTKSMSSRTLSLTWMANILRSSRTASATASMYPQSMSDGLGIPMPSAVSRMDATSSGSNSGAVGLPRITASGALRLSMRHPSAPPSRKSTNVVDPDDRESAAKRRMEASRTSGGVLLRYLCFRPSGGATRSSRDMPGGTSRP